LALINCNECGKEVSDNAKACPGCGNPVSEAPEVKINTNTTKNINTMALVGCLLGIVAWLSSSFGIIGVCACVFSIIGLRKFNPETEKGKEFAVVGLVLGACDIIFTIIYTTCKVFIASIIFKHLLQWWPY